MTHIFGPSYKSSTAELLPLVYQILAGYTDRQPHGKM